ncbi:T9SS type A sorting domain-containing protein [Dyadobacter luticola]|uniref:T9SS type A sorting domain-containing protein n=2 Tax=Dyadobacter luticola TaxID=1979387 RepID=A0A5R9KTT7_9BACT|nr:T9SS type A sorting domain-containing protein [Dyadobacter luticola]
MTKALFTLIQVVLLNAATLTIADAGTCTFTNLRLTTQSEVNSFSSSCTAVQGNVTVIGTGITDLSPLGNIITFDGNFTIQNSPSLPSLKGLEKLTSVKNLLIINNSLLTDLSGLEGLTNISTTLSIGSNNSLISLKGLDNLTSARSISISDNILLPDLTGLGKLDHVSDLLSITLNDALTSLNGLTSLTSVARINIGENDLLPDLSGLGALQSVSWQINVSYNKSLVSFNGLDNLTSLSELYIGSNDLITDLSGLEILRNVNWLVVGESPALTSLNGLNNLQSVTNLIIRSNPLLTNLSGLEGATSIGSLLITQNPILNSLDGLGGTESGGRKGANERVAALTIQSLTITSNPQLTTCAIAPVCAYVSNNTATVSGNGSGCQSQAAIETACSSLPVTLTQFTASAENHTALLKWGTSQESNSFSFEIEHSTDAKTWKKVGDQAAKNESNSLVNYQWIHATPNNDLNYYRLKMIDLDGSFAYSKVEHVMFKGLDPAAALIYPNPVSDILSVENKDDVVLLKIIDLQGKMIYETTNLRKEDLSVKKFVKGLYLMQLTRKSGVVQTQRFAVN